MSKSPWKSLTLWFNVFAAVYEVFAAAGVLETLPPEVRTAAVIAGNMLLRLRTKAGVSFT